MPRGIKAGTDLCTVCGRHHHEPRVPWRCPRCAKLRCGGHCDPCLQDISFIETHAPELLDD